jgi:histidinol-phosphate/aromatic aminotransferase/cobyric acid decarboxylase-like protein
MSRDQAFHGGAFFEAVGADLRNLDRSGRIVSADVLDAWFDPSPRVTAFLREHLEFLLKTSPPNHAEGLIAEVANSREVPPESVLAGSGSSSILFHCLPRLLPARPKAVVMDPMYSEYEHIVETLLDGELIRMTLAEAAGFVPSATALAALVPGTICSPRWTACRTRLWRWWMRRISNTRGRRLRSSAKPRRGGIWLSSSRCRRRTR